MKTFSLLTITCLIFIFNSCTDGNKFNVFSVEQDKQLGEQVKNYIESPASGLKVLDATKYSPSYQHLYKIRDYILSSQKLHHKKEFEWRARIIEDDSVLNAFATPGGYIYVYSGLIKFLDSDDELAGVLAHEIAHADQRHTTAMLTKNYGIELLMRVILGDDYGTLKSISENLIGLSFSRDAEEYADRLSVNYLCRENARYKPNGAAGFFNKLMQKNESNVRIVEFLSTHPNPPNRVQKIDAMAKKSGCTTNLSTDSTSYMEFKKNLP